MLYLILYILLLNLILTILTFIKMDELKELITRLKAAIVNISQDITDIKNSLPATGGLTPEQVAELKAELTTVVTDAEKLDSENPVPPAP